MAGRALGRDAGRGADSHVTHRVLTPPSGRGAIGVVQIRAPGPGDLAAFLDSAGLRSAVGRPVLGDLLGVDRGLVVRWDDRTADLFCHGGPAVLRGICGQLEALGSVAGDAAVVAYPEARDRVEEMMLGVLARAASPLAVDLLLDQPRRWREAGGGEKETEPALALRAGGEADGAVLSRLIDPPLVVAVGPANVGKSTLLNRLAGRSVSIVADAAGTTRDHVGATLDLGGLVVRYLDTPGLLAGATGVDAEAIGVAFEAMEAADLVLICGDPSAEPGPGIWDRLAPACGVVRVCLRRDLGEPGWRAVPDLEVSAASGEGIDGLVRTIRDRLVPPSALADDRPWRFWEAVGGAHGGALP